MSLWSNISEDNIQGAALIRHSAWHNGQASVDHHKHIHLTSIFVDGGRARLVYVASGTACGARLATSGALCGCLLARLARQRALWCLLVLAIVLVLSGCATDEVARVPVRNDVLLHVRLVEHIDYKPGTEAFGLTRCANDVCVVEILRDRYPYCLQHEIRHIFEGDWHAHRESIEGC
jgi:hypothetical protein